jgi:DtxR family manganese transport transcriptional regulator
MSQVSPNPLNRPGEPHAASFRKVRADHASETAQDYVEAIAAMVFRHGHCRVRDLVDHMGVSHVTIIRTLARLRDYGLVDTRPNQPIQLTAEGQRLAVAARKRHEVVLTFLLSLGVPREDALRDAEGMEHHVGKATLDCMANFVLERAQQREASTPPQGNPRHEV